MTYSRPLRATQPDVVKIDFTISAIVNIFTSAWDIINDLLLATVVDNTRTRLGKFRPYLLGMQIPLTLLGALYWMLPLFFPGSSATYIPKLICRRFFNADIVEIFVYIYFSVGGIPKKHIVSVLFVFIVDCHFLYLPP